MVCEKHTVAVFFFYLWSLIIFPNYVENVNFAAFFRRMRKKKIKKNHPKIRNYHSIHD